MKGILVFVIIVVLFMLAIVIGSQNTQVISVNYIIAQAEMRVSTFMVITIGLGVVIGFLVMFTRFFALKLQLKLVQRRLKKISKDSA
jgi:putative membrane protein